MSEFLQSMMDKYSPMLPEPVQDMIKTTPPLYLAASPVVVLTCIAIAPRTSLILILLLTAFGLGRIWDVMQLPAESGASRVISIIKMQPSKDDELVQLFHQEQSAAQSRAVSPTAVSLQVMASIDKLISYIVRDFINGWYVKLNHSNSQEFPEAIHVSLREAFVTLGLSASKMNPVNLVLAVIGVVLTHLREYKHFESTQLSLDEYIQQHPKSVFCRCSTPEQVNEHLRDLSMRISIHILPRADRSSSVVFGIVREILATTVLLSVVNKFSDPDWLNMTLLNALKPKPSSDMPAPTANETDFVDTGADTASITTGEIKRAASIEDSFSETGISETTSLGPSSIQPRHVLDTTRPLSISFSMSSGNSISLPKRLKYMTIRSINSLKRLSLSSTSSALTTKTQIHVKVLESRQLPVISTHQVYCTAAVGTQSFKSSKVPAETNPVWDFSCWFGVPEETGDDVMDASIRCIVVDIISTKNIFTGELIGTVRIELNDLEPNRIKRAWIPIDTTRSRLAVSTDAEMLIEAVYINTDMLDDLESTDDEDEAGCTDHSDRADTVFAHMNDANSFTFAPSISNIGGIAVTSWDILNINGSAYGALEMYTEFLIQGGHAGHIRIYHEMEEFERAARGVMSNSVDSKYTSITELHDLALQIVTDIRSAITRDVLPLSFGDMNENLETLNKVRKEIDVQIHPELFKCLQERIEAYLDSFMLETFKQTETFIKFVQNDGLKPVEPVQPTSECKPIEDPLFIKAVDDSDFSSVTTSKDLNNSDTSLPVSLDLDVGHKHFRRDNIKTAIQATRDRISVIGESISTADPDTLQTLLESKFALQTDLDSLMEMLSDEEFHHESLEGKHTSNVSSKPIDSLDSFVFVDLDGVSIGIVDAVDEAATTLTQRPGRSDSLLRLGSIINATGVIAAQTLGASTLSTNLGGGHSTSSTPFVAFEFIVTIKSREDDTWTLVKTYEEFERLHRLLCVHFSKANAITFPARPPLEGLVDISNDISMTSTAASIFTGGAFSTASHAADAIERHTLRVNARKHLASELEMYLKQMVQDTVLRLSTQVITFLSKPASVHNSGDATPTSASLRHVGSNGELGNMMLRAFKSAGSALKKVATVGDGNSSLGTLSTISQSLSNDTRSFTDSKSSVASVVHPTIAQSDSQSDSQPETPTLNVAQPVNAEWTLLEESDQPNTQHLKSHETLPEKQHLSQSDLNVILECTISAIEEVFQLTSPTQWIRQQSLHVVRVVLYQTYGSTISSWMQRKVEGAMSEESAIKCLDGISGALWPDGRVWGSNITHEEGVSPQVRNDDDKRDTRISAKSVLMVGGEEDPISPSPIKAKLDTLARVVGKQNASVGLARIFNMIQVQRLNISLLCLLLECIVKNVLNQ
ncbi:Sorting nexin-20 [Batrachochytrium dendrobatidis]|nr:Sorting nexin-20 [Batrachochytrium dendrobatidis]